MSICPECGLETFYGCGCLIHAGFFTYECPSPETLESINKPIEILEMHLV